jgi:rod shape-determining protein MreD
MLRFLVYLFLFFVATILQTVVVPKIEIYGAQPSFLLILTIIAALRNGPLAGCFIGFMSGLLCDVYAPVEWLGAYSLAYCVIGFVVGQIEESFIKLNLFLKIVVLALADIIKDIIYFIAIGKSGNEIAHALFSISFPNVLYTIFLGAGCFYLFSTKKEMKIEMYNKGL